MGVSRRAAASLSIAIGLVACRPHAGTASDDPPEAPPQPIEPGAIEGGMEGATDLGAFQTCTRSFGSPAPDPAIGSRPITDLTPIEDVSRVALAGTRLLVEGYPVDWHVCPPCPAGVFCKPCESYVVLAATPMAGIKQPITKDLDLWIMTAHPQALQRGTRYRVVLDVCAGPSPVGASAHLEWRGATPRP